MSVQAVAVFSGYLTGSVLFSQDKDTSLVTIEGHLKGFKNLLCGRVGTKHGFHIHRNGDLRRGCESGCDHFNPWGKSHGGLDDPNSHAGDLGNITVGPKGSADFVIETQKISLTDPKTSILGRMLICHYDEDDLGRGGHEDSYKTGHAGKRLACGVIGLVDQPLCH